MSCFPSLACRHCFTPVFCSCRNEQVLECLRVYARLDSADVAAFTDIKEAVGDLVKDQISNKAMACPLLEGLKPVPPELPVRQAEGGTPVSFHGSGGGVLIFCWMFRAMSREIY